jgi:hypothetical protein
MSPKHIRITGTGILLAGLVAAAAIYFTAGPDETQKRLGIDIRTNRERGQLENMGGKSYVLIKDFEDWFAQLWHGRQLGYTVGVLSAFGFLVARALAHVDEEHQRELARGAATRSSGSTGQVKSPTPPIKA